MLAKAHARDGPSMNEDDRLESLTHKDSHHEEYVEMKRKYIKRSDALTAERRRCRSAMNALLRIMKAYSNQHERLSPVDVLRPYKTPTSKDGVLLKKKTRSAPSIKKPKKNSGRSKASSSVTRPSVPAVQPVVQPYNPFAGGAVPNRNDPLPENGVIPPYRQSDHMYWRENGDLMTLGAINRARKHVRYMPFDSLPEAWLHKEKGDQLAKEGRLLGAPGGSNSGGKAPRQK